jgi:hypothetical protein
MSDSNYTGVPKTRNDRRHAYLSTACLHENHEHCQCKTNLEGEEKIPGTCKWCAAPCICPCHRSGLTPDQQRFYERLEVLVDQALAQYEQGYAVNVESEMTALARELR